MEKLLVIDGNSMINRAFYGIRELSTSSGHPTNATYGLINIVRLQLESLCPDYACIAFDVKAPNFRLKIYPEYKAGRRQTPPELITQFEDAKECMRLMGVHVAELPGYEADDILGTVASLAATRGIDAYILTGDRDLLQMIAPHITVLLATNSETVSFDKTRFHERFGVDPEQYIDVKSLMGDPSDHIPGVPGIGEKTAFRLISCFGTLDAVYSSIDNPSIKRGIREKLIQGKDMAYIAKELVTVLHNAPIDFTIDDLTYTGFRDGLQKKLEALEFQNLIRKLNLHETRTQFKQTEEIYTSVGADDLLALPADMTLMILNAGESWHIATESGISLSYTGPLTPLAPLFNGSRRVVCFDAKALLHVLRAEGVTDVCPLLDLMLYAYVLNPNGSAKTVRDTLTEAFGDESVPDGSTLALRMLSAEPILARKISDMGMTGVLNDIELPLTPVLADMEAYGCKIHRRGLTAFGDELDQTISSLTTDIYNAAGHEFNINSTKQMATVLYEELGLPAARHTKSGYSTDVDALEKLRPLHPIVGLILDYRQVTKLRSTYVTALLRVADADDRIHTDFKQALTATGRLSSADPNLQNIPIRTELGREMRRFFIASDDDHVLIDADYSQIELRLLAHIAGDETMTDAFNHNVDIHTKTAALVFGVPEEAVTPELRKRAKAVNFGIIYGIGPFSLGQDLGITTAQAKRYIESYLNTYPAIREYMTTVVDNANKNGYTVTLTGRRRYIPELHAQNKNLQAFGTRVAMNSPIQGTAADLIKLAMIRVSNRLRAECPDAHLIMQIHDELLVESPRADADRAASILRDAMEHVCTLRVPLTVDLTVADNWLDD